MNQNIGSLGMKGINIFGMRLDNYMAFLKIWQHTYMKTSKIFHTQVISIQWFFLELDDKLSRKFDRKLLHKYANEDVSLGAWLIGLDVEHIDDRRLCCGTPPGQPCYCFEIMLRW